MAQVFNLSALQLALISNALTLPASSNTTTLTGISSRVFLPLSTFQRMMQMQQLGTDDSTPSKFIIVDSVIGTTDFGMNINTDAVDVIGGVYVDATAGAGGVDFPITRGGALVGVNSVAMDHIRHQSHFYFGTVFATSAFENEGNVSAQLQTDFSAAFKGALSGLVEYNTLISEGTAETGSGTMVVESIFSQIRNSAPARLANPLIKVHGTTTGMVQLPFLEGDILAFQCTIATNANQIDLTDTTGLLPTKTYLIQMELTGDSSTVEDNATLAALLVLKTNAATALTAANTEMAWRADPTNGSSEHDQLMQAGVVTAATTASTTATNNYNNYLAAM